MNEINPKVLTNLYLLKSLVKLFIRLLVFPVALLVYSKVKRIGRAKNVETLSVEIKKLKNQQQILSQNLLESEKEFEQIKLNDKVMELEELKDEINRINESHATFKTRQEQFYNLLNSNSTRKEDIENQINDIRKEINILQPKQKEQKTKLVEFEKKLNEQKASAEECKKLLASKSLSYNEANVAISKKKIR